MAKTVVYNKYTKGRHLYDVTNGRHSTVDDVAVQLSLGNTVIVYSSQGKDKVDTEGPLADITNQIVLQALLRREIEKPFLSRGAVLALWK